MSSLIRWDPIERGISLREAMNQLLEESFMWDWSFPKSGMQSLALDVRETDEALVIEGSLPGIKPADVDISISRMFMSGRMPCRLRTCSRYLRSVKKSTALYLQQLL